MASPDSESQSLVPSPSVETYPQSPVPPALNKSRVTPMRTWQERRKVQLVQFDDEIEPGLSTVNHAGGQRRSRADTMPSQSSAFPYSSDRFAPLAVSTSATNTANPAGHTPSGTTGAASSPLRSRSGSVTQPPTLQNPFGGGIFHTWMGDSLQSPTTPTTDQLLKEDDSNTIASTLASLGLDDERDRRHTIHASHSYSSLRSLDRLADWYHQQHLQQQPQQMQSLQQPQQPQQPQQLVQQQQQQQQQQQSQPTQPHSSQQHQHQQTPPQHVSSENYWNLRSDDLRLHSLASARLQAQAGRPRAISMSVADHRHGEGSPTPMSQTHRSIWGTNNLRSSLGPDMISRPRPFLRSSNSSADLLEKMARQRKTAATGVSSSPVIDEFDDWDGTPLAMPGLPYDLSDDHTSGKTSPTSFSAAQTPTRSLWLGNIDPSLTHAELTQVFTHYGAIDSVRILPDRECAFVNFMSLEDALCARDVLVNKLGCRLGNTIVKVGFGKPEAVPQSQACGVTELGANAQGPTRALWIGNIPATTTPAALVSLFASFGPIESVRVLSHKNCGFVNFDTQEDAVRAKKALQGREIMGPGSGIVRIGFAKVPTKPNQSPSTGYLTDEPGMDDKFQPQQSQIEAQMMYYMVTEMMSGNSVNVYAAVAAERQHIMKEFGKNEEDDDAENEPAFDELRMPLSYYPNIPAAPELGQTRRIDIARLRDIRKRLDIGNVPTKELEGIAMECVEEIVELCSDYIGNTVIQRLFERCTETTKSIMIEAVAPHLASIGVHKNGTWAAQKMIDTAKLVEQIDLICSSIKPFVPALLLDQFGNYVVQCCLGLGPDWNQFIFDAVVDNCWEISQGRFGARAVRATLESPHVTKHQQRYVAAALVQHALLLATNANGALLLIWLLDTSGIPGRYRILAPRLTPHLSQLCTHKLASLTVLKLINQRQEPDARAVIIDALFFSASEQMVDEVLMDQVHGVGLVQKILSSSYVELRERQRIAERVKQLLAKLKVQHIQGYKRLVEEINMVMGDSIPGASLGTLPGMMVPPSFAMTPEIAAALQAKYMNGTSDQDPDLIPPQAFAAAAMMANWYAAATATSTGPPLTPQPAGRVTASSSRRASMQQDNATEDTPLLPLTPTPPPNEER